MRDLAGKIGTIDAPHFSVAAHFKELDCWQLSNDLKKAVYAFTASEAAKRDRSFCDDVRRAAMSAPANIVEGFGRYGTREFAHFLSIARASLLEIESHLEHAHDTRLIDTNEFERLTLARRTQKTTAGLRAHVLRTEAFRRR